MSDTFPPFIAEFNAVINECAAFRYITRDSALQKQACERISQLQRKIADEKRSAVSSTHEEYANLLLGCECVCEAVVSEIEMWVLLKESQPDRAWNALISAQNKLWAAIKADEGFAHLEKNIKRLEAIEHIVFPPQVFLSSGMIVKSEICSICQGDYDDCPHVKGRPYMGEFCTVTLVPSEIDHVAIVDRPADKRCRIEKFSTEGGYRNRMTWAVEATDEKSVDGGIQAGAVVATSRTFIE